MFRLSNLHNEMKIVSFPYIRCCLLEQLQLIANVALHIFVLCTWTWNWGAVAAVYQFDWFSIRYGYGITAVFDIFTTIE